MRRLDSVGVGNSDDGEQALTSSDGRTLKISFIGGHSGENEPVRRVANNDELLTGLALCPSCGALCADVDGPTHPYMVAPAGCWAAFGALQADEMARFGYPPVHGLIVDAYAASHGGDGSARRDRQSVCIHLIALCAVIDGAETPRGRIALLQRLTKRKIEWPRLKRPAGLPGLSHTHAVDAPDLEDYTRRGRVGPRRMGVLGP